MVKLTPVLPLASGDEFAAYVEGIDLCHPLHQKQVRAIDRGMEQYAVLVFRDQALTDEQQLNFSRYFGELETSISAKTSIKRRVAPEIADISNLDANERVMAPDDRMRYFNLGNQLWHSDSSFKPISAAYSLLSGRVVPDRGGNTEFSDMRAAYDTLDAGLKKEVEGLICEHSLLYSRALLGFDDFTEKERERYRPVRQPLVRTHPVTQRKSLFLSSHAGGIEGWPVPEARALLRELREHATQRQFIYVHEWRRNDLVMWDNATTMHRARRFDSNHVIRDLRRTTIAGKAVLVE
ncbi:MAG: TauD/TfdA family dioxygenase [Sneathiella sp.]